MKGKDHTHTCPHSGQPAEQAFFYAGETNNQRIAATLSDIINTMDIAMWQVDMERKIVGSNEKAKNIFGYDIAGNHCYRISAKGKAVCTDCPVQGLLNGEAIGRSEQRFVDAADNEFYIDHFASPIKDEQGEMIGALVFSIDITEKKRMEHEIMRHRDELEALVNERTQALEEKEARYRELWEKAKTQEALHRSLIESCADPIAVCHLNGGIHYLNPAFTETFGWKLEDFEATVMSFVLQDKQAAFNEQKERVTATGIQVKGVQTQLVTKDGRTLDVDTSLSRYVDHQNRPAGLLIAFRDRTDSAAVERRQLQSRKLEAIGTLAGGVAHDFNNILMGIQGRVSLMMSEMGSHHPYYEHASSIKEYIQSATDLTRQLLGFARGGKYEVKTINLNELVDKSLTLVGLTQKSIKIHKKYDEHLWNVGIDVQQIEQVLLNLYANAMQAMPSGGNLYLHTENIIIEEDHTKPFHVNTGKYVKISITDTGVGMDQSTVQQVFDPFFTTKEMGRGTGLGLASAYGIVKNHKGIITVYSEIGHGATFNIYLPATRSKPDDGSSTKQKILFGKETVLLLDDEKMVLDVGRPMLEKIGYTVFVASSGKEAIEIYKSDLTNIDLIIVDMIMPEMNGGQVYDELKKINPDVKALLSSGYSINGAAEEILSRGCNGFIQKPFGLSTLSQKIRKILDE